MQLPDEAVSFQYQSLLFQAKSDEEWRPSLELQSQHFLSPKRIKALEQQILQVRSQMAAERDLVEPPPASRPLDAAFIDMPEKMLNDHRRKKEQSELGRIMTTASRLQGEVDRVVVLGIGGSYLGARALFEALKSLYHNELPSEVRLSTPRMYFEGNNFDNESLQELLQLLQNTCVNPSVREERWATIVISKSGKTLETSAALRVFRREAAELYGAKSEEVKQFTIPVTGGGDSKVRALFKADGYKDEDLFAIPDRVGGRFSVFTAAGLLPAAIVGLDVRAILLGATAMTKQFLEEPFERNAVLQLAAVNYLMTQELGKNIRILSVWSKKLEALGLWYDQLLAESLGKQGVGPTPITSVQTRDLHSRGQQHQEGRRDKLILNVVVKQSRAAPIPIGMADRNEDDLNQFSRKNYPALLDAAYKGTCEAYSEVGRPTAEITLPSITEHSMGQIMQMLMLATVIEGRLMGINPYGQPGVEAYKRKMMQILSAQPSMSRQNVLAEKPAAATGLAASDKVTG